MYTFRSTTSRLLRNGVIEDLTYSLSQEGQARVSHMRRNADTNGTLTHIDEEALIPKDAARELLRRGGSILTDTCSVTVDDFVHIEMGINLPTVDITQEDLFRHQTLQQYGNNAGIRSCKYWMVYDDDRTSQKKYGRPWGPEILKGAEMRKRKWEAVLKPYQIPPVTEGNHAMITEPIEVLTMPPLQESRVKYSVFIREVVMITKRVPEAFFMTAVFQNELQEPAKAKDIASMFWR